MSFTNYETLKLKNMKFVRWGGNNNLIANDQTYYNTKVLQANFVRGRNGETEGEILIQHGEFFKQEKCFLIIGDNKTRTFKPRKSYA